MCLLTVYTYNAGNKYQRPVDTLNHHRYQYFRKDPGVPSAPSKYSPTFRKVFTNFYKSQYYLRTYKYRYLYFSSSCNYLFSEVFGSRWSKLQLLLSIVNVHWSESFQTRVRIIRKE